VGAGPRAADRTRRSFVSNGSTSWTRRGGERRGTSPMQSARRCSKSYLPVSPNQLPENVALPGGIRLVFQPTHSPELQPAEHLGAFADEPLANRCFDTVQSLDQAVGDRCIALTQELDIIRDSTLFHYLNPAGLVLSARRPSAPTWCGSTAADHVARGWLMICRRGLG